MPSLVGINIMTAIMPITTAKPHFPSEIAAKMIANTTRATMMSGME
jgi:hypothetical protein